MRLIQFRILATIVIALASSGCLSFRVQSSTPTLRFVKTDGVDSGDCSRAEAACATLAYAVSQAIDGDTIAVYEGTHVGPSTVVTKALTIWGQGRDSTYLQADDDSVLVVAPNTTLGVGALTIQNTGVLLGNGGGVVNRGTLTMNDVTIRNNSATELGGGIFNDVGGTLWLYRCALESNIAPEGGGLANRGSVSLQNSAINANRAENGGGLSNLGSMQVWKSTITDNAAINGAGIFTAGGTLTLSESTVSHNTAARVGGGLYQLHSEVKFFTNVVDHNTAQNGGGFYLWGNQTDITSLILSATTVAFNQASERGGGLYNDTDPLSTALVTISAIRENTATGDGGGIFNMGVVEINESEVSFNQIRDEGFGGGSGIFNWSVLRLRHSSVAGNRSSNFPALENRGDADLDAALIFDNSSGGGIGNHGESAKITVSKSTIRSNTGPGIHNGGELRLEYSTVSDNTAVGLLNSSGARATLLNDTISNNAYAGIEHWGTRLWVDYSTIAFNRDYGIKNYGLRGPALADYLILEATIVSDNVPENCTGTPGVPRVQSSGYNLESETTWSQGTCTLLDYEDDLIGVSPRLGPLQDNGGPTHTHALLSGSPAINHVDTPFCLGLGLFDQRFVVRPRGPACDIGAYER